MCSIVTMPKAQKLSRTLSPSKTSLVLLIGHSFPRLVSCLRNAQGREPPIFPPKPIPRMTTRGLSPKVITATVRWIARAAAR